MEIDVEGLSCGDVMYHGPPIVAAGHHLGLGDVAVQAEDVGAVFSSHHTTRSRGGVHESGGVRSPHQHSLSALKDEHFM